MKIHGKVVIGEDVYLENEYPERVELHDGVGIAVRSMILAHGRGEPSRVIIGRNAVLLAQSVIAATPGTTVMIGEGAVVGAMCVVTHDVPPHTLILGSPSRPVARVTVPFTFGTTYEEFKAGLRPLDDPEDRDGVPGSET